VLHVSLEVGEVLFGGDRLHGGRDAGDFGEAHVVDLLGREVGGGVELQASCVELLAVGVPVRRSRVGLGEGGNVRLLEEGLEGREGGNDGGRNDILEGGHGGGIERRIGFVEGSSEGRAGGVDEVLALLGDAVEGALRGKVLGEDAESEELGDLLNLNGDGLEELAVEGDVGRSLERQVGGVEGQVVLGALHAVYAGEIRLSARVLWLGVLFVGFVWRDGTR